MALRSEMASCSRFQAVSLRRCGDPFSPGHKLVLRNSPCTVVRPLPGVRAGRGGFGDVSNDAAAEEGLELGRRALLAGVAISAGVLGNVAGWVAPVWATIGVLEPEIYGDAAAQKRVYDLTQAALQRALRERTDVPVLEGMYLRAAFHDAGTWNADNKTGGANGSLQFEAKDRKNVGLEEGIKVLVEVKEKLNKEGCPVTMADTFQIAGAEAMASSGGPKIRVEIGRKDATRAGSTDQLPPGTDTADDLIKLFKRNGYTVEELVALSGSHTIGRGRFFGGGRGLDSTPEVFDNNYYKRILAGDGLFTSDNTLATDSRTRRTVARYSRDARAFTNDFVAAYLKMGKFGVNGPGTVAPRIT